MHPLAVTRGVAALGVDATVGVTDIVEDMYRNIAAGSLPFGAPPEGSARGIAGFVHSCIRGTAKTVGLAVDSALHLTSEQLQAVTPDAAPLRPLKPEQELWLSALNGVIGDHLDATNNPLAIPMQFRVGGQPLDLANADKQLHGASDTLLLAVHGLCMHPKQWARGDRNAASSHSDAVRAATGCTPVDLWYNTGRAISDNGEDLADQLEQLFDAWPTRLRRIQLIGHSMGGLVLRSALAHADSQGHRWRQRVSHLVCLGTPHLGAPAERLGHAFNSALTLSPYTAPLGKLGWLRSTGITDLRDGKVLADLIDTDRFQRGPREIIHVPLPEGVACSAAAGSLGSERCDRKDLLLGDGLVLRNSALGQPAGWNQQATPSTPNQPGLAFAPERCRLFMQTNHWQLLDDGPVRAFVLQQLTH